MLIVGSRPHMLAHMEAYVRLIDKYMVCYFIKFGLSAELRRTVSV